MALVLVERTHSKYGLIYICELCGFGYSDVETAERCEEFCDLHGGSALNINCMAVFRPRIRVVSESVRGRFALTLS